MRLPILMAALVAVIAVPSQAYAYHRHPVVHGAREAGHGVVRGARTAAHGVYHGARCAVTLGHRC